MSAWLMPKSDDGLEDVYMRAEAFTALLIRYAEAESMADRTGMNTKLEQSAWRGVEVLLSQVREDLAKINNALDKATS